MLTPPEMQISSPFSSRRSYLFYFTLTLSFSPLLPFSPSPATLLAQQPTTRTGEPPPHTPSINRTWAPREPQRDVLLPDGRHSIRTTPLDIYHELFTIRALPLTIAIGASLDPPLRPSSLITTVVMTLGPPPASPSPQGITLAPGQARSARRHEGESRTSRRRLRPRTARRSSRRCRSRAL